MRHRYKALFFDYDRIKEQEEYEPTLVCLSATSKMLFLSSIPYVGWMTRYTGENIDQAKITDWRELAESELIMGICIDEFCAMVALCITEGEGTIAALDFWAIQNGVASGGGTATHALPLDTRESNMLPDDYICDEDHRFGMAQAVEQAIHTATVEVLEAIELLVDPLELAAEIADDIPIVELIAIAADVILWMKDTAIEAYDSAYSQTVADEIACQIFCRMFDTGACYLSPQLIADVFLDFPHPMPPSWDDPFEDWWEFIENLPLVVNESIVKAVSLLGFIAMMYGGKFGRFALGLRSLETVIALSSDDTSTDHSILCDPCPPPGWLADIDLTSVDGGFELDDVPLGVEAGEYLEGVGWHVTSAISPTSPAFKSNAVIINLPFAVNADLKEVSMTYNYENGSWTSSSTRSSLSIKRGSDLFQMDEDEMSDGDDQIDGTNNSVIDSDRLGLSLRCARNLLANEDNGDALITRVQIVGKGDIPDELLPYIVT